MTSSSSLAPFPKVTTFSEQLSHIIRYSLKFIAFVIIVIKLERSSWGAFEQAHYPIGPSKIITTILIGPAPQQLSYKKSLIRTVYKNLLLQKRARNAPSQ